MTGHYISDNYVQLLHYFFNKILSKLLEIPPAFAKAEEREDEGETMKGETKEERFRRIAERRVQRVLDSIRSLSQCCNKRMYEWNDEQLRKIWKVIDNELRKCRKRVRTGHNRKTLGPNSRDNSGKYEERSRLDCLLPLPHFHLRWTVFGSLASLQSLCFFYLSSISSNDLGQFSLRIRDSALSARTLPPV